MHKINRKIIFRIDYQKDAWNYVRIAKLEHHDYGADLGKITSGIPADLLTNLRHADEAGAKSLAEKYLLDNKENFLPDLQTSKRGLEEYFSKHGLEIFITIEKLFSRTIHTSEFSCSLTTLSSCPYDVDSDWFMVYYKWPTNGQARCVVHEILHLIFHHYWTDYCLEKGLSKKQFQDLKEALTFLLNEPVFSKFGLGTDYGYPNHQELRAELKKLYDQDKDFDRFLEKATALVKEKY